VNAVKPTWEERAPLRPWYSGMWASISIVYIWLVWDADVAVWWPLALSLVATLTALLLGYKLRIMDPVSWAMWNVAFTRR
jgi:hypothetical protein